MSDRRLPELFSRTQWKCLAERFRLTPRQLQTARLICREYSNRRIAEEMDVSYDTVRMHVSELLKRLNVHSRVGVPVRLAVASRRLASESVA